jgi:hypothetical protein
LEALKARNAEPAPENNNGHAASNIISRLQRLETFNWSIWADGPGFHMSRFGAGTRSLGKLSTSLGSVMSALKLTHLLSAPIEIVRECSKLPVYAGVADLA